MFESGALLPLSVFLQDDKTFGTTSSKEVYNDFSEPLGASGKNYDFSFKLNAQIIRHTFSFS